MFQTPPPFEPELSESAQSFTNSPAPLTAIAPLAMTSPVDFRRTSPVEVMPAVFTIVPSTSIGARVPVVVSVPVTVLVLDASRVIPAFAETATKLSTVPVEVTTSPVPDAATVPEAVTVPEPVRVTSPVEVIAATDTLVPLTVTGERAAVVVIVPVAVAVVEPRIETPELPETAVKLIAVPVALKVAPVPVALTAAVEVTVPVPVNVTLPVAVIPAV